MERGKWMKIVGIVALTLFCDLCFGFASQSGSGAKKAGIQMAVRHPLEPESPQ